MPAWGWLVAVLFLLGVIWWAALNGWGLLMLAAGLLLLLIVAACGWAIWVGIQSTRPGDKA